MRLRDKRLRFGIENHYRVFLREKRYSVFFSTKDKKRSQNLRTIELIITFAKHNDMIIEYDKPYLEELYTTGDIKSKKYRFPEQVKKKYVKVVTMLESVSRKEDLYRYNSLNYEALSGNKSGTESVRVNDKYRIEFTTRIEGDEAIVTICRLLELSNHYQ